MALKNSSMLPLGTRLPKFSLPNVRMAEVISSDSFPEHPALLIMFICRHCPYVVHVQDELAKLGRDFLEREVAIIAISSNDIKSHPLDDPKHLREMADTLGFRFPFCYDESQEVAKAFAAACTPEFFLFDGKRVLVYRGQLDDSRPGNGKPVTGRDLRKAIESVLSGQSPSTKQIPSAGCNIKWKPGNEPDYA